MLNKAVSFITGVPNKIWAALAALLLVGGTVWYCSDQVEDRVEQAEVIGQTNERNSQLESTIRNVKTAEEARDEINSIGPSGDLARYDQCLRSARTPENCERFLPAVRPTDN